jgi:hypothetical protein
MRAAIADPAAIVKSPSGGLGSSLSKRCRNDKSAACARVLNRRPYEVGQRASRPRLARMGKSPTKGCCPAAP